MTRKGLSLAILVALAVPAAAQADEFYLRVGENFSGVGDLGTKVDGPGSNTTGVFDEATFTYWSTTVVTDAQTFDPLDPTNGYGVFSPGDTVVGSGGLLNTVASGVGYSTLSENQITGFKPAPDGTASAPSDNGYKNGWFLSMGWDDLAGTVNDQLGVVYTSGTIIVYYGPNQASMIPVMEIAVNGGANNGIGQSLDVTGLVDFGNIDTTVLLSGLNSYMVTIAELFNWAVPDEAFVATVGDINWESNQNTSPFWINGQCYGSTIITGCLTDPQYFDPTNAAWWGRNIFWDNGDYVGEGYLAGEHDGSLSFSRIPEPTTVALMSIGLLGAGWATRRRKS